jgi:hypothetical protein
MTGDHYRVEYTAGTYVFGTAHAADLQKRINDMLRRGYSVEQVWPATSSGRTVGTYVLYSGQAGRQS